MRKDIMCEKCEKVLGWYDHDKRIINIFDKDGKAEYVGDIIVATVKCCDAVQNIELK